VSIPCLLHSTDRLHGLVRYQALEPPTPPPPKMELEGTNSLTSVEMVTVPALGPEWAKSELRDMTKAGKEEKKSESRKDKWKRWNRGQGGMCGSFCTRQLFVWFMFGLCVVYVELLDLMLRVV
jgi:hypothetical protein